MNGEPNANPQVPVTTLAGIASLTELLPELPLPSSSVGGGDSRSLLFHPRVAEEAQRLLSCQDPALVQQLANSLALTHADNIELKQQYVGTDSSIQLRNAPALLEGILRCNPTVFTGKPGGLEGNPVIKTEGGKGHGPINHTTVPKHINNVSVIQCGPVIANAPQVKVKSEPGGPPAPSVPPRPTKPETGDNAVVKSKPDKHSSITETGDNVVVKSKPDRHSSITETGDNVVVKSKSDKHSSITETGDNVVVKSKSDNVVGLTKAMKEPVVVLNKLSSEELRLKLAGIGTNTVNTTKTEDRKERERAPETPSKNSNSGSRSSRSQRKYREVSSDSESSEDDKKKQTKYFKNRDKERDEKKKKDKADRKRNRIQSDEDDYNPEQETKRRKKGGRESPSEEDEDSDYDGGGGGGSETPRHKSRGGAPLPTAVPKKPTYTNKRLEKKLVPQQEKLSAEELMETGVYQRFNRAVEKIFDNTEELDLTVEIEEDGDIPQEYLIPKYELADLCSEAAKLKSSGAMAVVPTERLVRLLNILEKNIRDGAKVTPICDEDDDDDDDKLWMELVMERILRGMDASLTAMNILTSANMSKRVYLEDVIERCVQFTKFQLSNTIYPSFDPVYRVDSKRDGYVGNKRKRGQCKDVRNRSIIGLYNKLHQLVGLLADLLSIQTLTDTTVLQLSTMGVAPFFVENVSELQLSALQLVTKVFSKYNKHRRLLLDDILASIARLPSSKRSLRTYRLNSDENIQMLTALVLQLIQCVVELPEELGPKVAKSGSEHDSQNSKESKDPKAVKPELNMDRDVLVCSRYETAMSTAYSFLSVFLQKTGSKNEEIDYRPLFENFVQDLLATVNKPEWPAAELLLSLLGKLLVQKFCNKNTDMALRVSSLDCLGVVAAKLRRDAVSSQLEMEHINSIIQEVKDEENKDGPMWEDSRAPAENGTTEKSSTPSSKKSKKKKGSSDKVKDADGPTDEEEERTRFLQRVLLDWLAVNSGSEAALLHGRHFYIGQWYREAYTEIMRQKNGPLPPSNTRKSSSHNKKKRKRRSGDSSEEESSEESEDEDDEELIRKGQVDEALAAEVTQLSEQRKHFLLTKIPPFPPASPGAKTQILQTHIGYENAELITRYLASKRPFSQSFDVYLKHILRVLTESAIAVRTKAMKCLTMVVEADPGVLSRSDMQMGVHHSFLDHSTSVREAAVDLIGKFVLSRPEVLNTYYEMIAARILDTGVSVRKRVIKILKDICLECPDFKKIPEICVKMIRRVNDEEGIKKLVQEVFVNMWFTPVRERPHMDEEGLLRKINNITEVVIACKDTGLDWFEQLLHSMFKPKEDKDDVTKINTEPPKSLVTACKQIVDCLVRHILVIEEGNEENQKPEEPEGDEPRTTSQRLLACHQTLFLFAKIRPQLLVDHAITLQPYLAWRCRTQVDYTMIGVVARTLELVVPLMEHPSETFLSQLEEDAVKLILQHDRTVITSCLALLGSIVNTVTKNYRLIKDCFNRYHNFIADYKKLNEESPDSPRLESYKPFFRRALYTIGLLLKHFDLRNQVVRCGLPDNIAEQVFETLMYFMGSPDTNLKYCTLQAVGFVCIRHYELMMGSRLKDLYHMMLLDPSVNTQLRIQTLQNVETYLQEEEVRMIKQDQEWAKQKTRENLKEMCDIQSGMASAIIQNYLKEVLECVVSGSVVVRHSALRVIQLVLAQGLVHPVQIVPYLVCMSTDTEEAIAHSADKQLQDIEKKYPGFIGMKAMQGFRLSYRLQSLIQTSSELTRGLRVKEGELPGALNGFLYSTMRTTKQHRRALVLSLMKQFDEQARTSLTELLFIGDNLAYFPYQVLDEPLFIIHHIDIMISVTGANLLQSFREALIPSENAEMTVNPETGLPEYVDDLEDEEDVEVYLARFPPCLTPLVECINASQGCLLLLMLKEHLKEVYGITDGRIYQYSPSDTTKQYEKSAPRKSTTKFNPKSILKRLQEDSIKKAEMEQDVMRHKLDLINKYLDFKALMLKIDPEEEDSDNEETKKAFHGGTPVIPSTRSLRGGGNQNPTDHVPLLPGTHDGWKAGRIGTKSVGTPNKQFTANTEQPKGAEATTTVTADDVIVVEHKSEDAAATRRTPIGSITVRTPKVTPPREHRSSHHHHRSHRSSSHKKHKKKKKRKKNSDSEEESEFSDPDFLV